MTRWRSRPASITPGVGPEHEMFRAVGRYDYRAVDDEAAELFDLE